MKLHDLQPPSGAHKPARRVGRGHGSGRGKTAGRGTKGQKSRAGQHPGLVRGRPDAAPHAHAQAARLQEPVRVEYAGLNLGRLSDVAAGTLVTPTCCAMTACCALQDAGAAGQDPGRWRRAKGA